MFHKSFRSVFGKKDTQFGEDTDVSAIKTHTSFKKRNHFVGITEFFVVLSQFFKMVGVDNNIKTSDGSELEFSRFNTSHGQFLPCLGGVSLLSSINSLLELFKSNETRSNLSVVLGGSEEEFSSFVVLFIVTTITNALVVNGVRTRDEVFEFGNLISLSEGENESIIDLSILNVFTSHGKILNELFIFTINFSRADNLEVHSVILGLNVAINSFSNVRSVKVSISKLAPDFRVADLLGIFSSSRNVINIVKENFNSLNGQVVLNVDDVSFFVELILFTESNFSDFGTIVIIKTVNVIHNFSLVTLDGSDDQ